MDKFNQFSDKQFGFMGGRSTSLQLLKVLDKWTSVLDEGGVLNAVYVDCIKAFDKVPHTSLLVKMKAYGLSEKICIWVQDFLSDRTQGVEVNGMKSQWHKAGADPGFPVREEGALKKIAPSGGRREKVWGISCEKSRFYAKISYFFQF